MKKILTTLRADLLDTRITDIVGNNVYLNFKPEEKESNMFIIYNIIDERPNTYVGNRALFTNYYIQIDIFTKGDFSEIMEVVKDILLEKDYYYTEGFQSYEEDTKLFHAGLRFIKQLEN